MKYLKSFNESKKIENELAEFTNDCLIHLIDDNYEIVTKCHNYNHVSPIYDISIYAPGMSEYDDSDEGVYGDYNGVDYSEYPNFEYNDIKNHFIPYIVLLSEEYHIFSISLYISGDVIPVSTSDIVNDEVNFYNINSILVRLRDK